MYLKSLTLHGFKSFPNRTVLNFERGATVIVGPNGSGKSNISDAMRWVLGELSSRNIRGTKMEDVIFGGTDTRRPMGYAEVSVTFDNTDPENRLDSPYDEITVTRRYYRGGQSEYLINSQSCRLRDIYQLFLNTGVGREGYSIIGQGRIAEILSRKSEDRRGIFEEAAGISKYRVDKEQAERNLSNNEINLTRVRDILFELESRVGPLEKEAEKARKGIEISQQKKEVDVALWIFDTAKLRSDLTRVEEQYRLAENELVSIKEALESLEQQRIRLREKNQNNTLLAEELLQKMTDTTKEMRELDRLSAICVSAMEHAEFVIGQAKNAIETHGESTSSLTAKKTELSSRMDALVSEKEEIADLRLELLAEMQAVTSDSTALDRDLDRGLVELNKLEHSAVDYAARISFLTQSQNDGDGKGGEITDEIRKYKEIGERLREEAEKCDRNAKEFRDKIAAFDTQKTEAEKTISELLEEKANENEKLSELRVEKNTLLQRVDMLRRMEEQLEGYGGSIRAVMKEYEAGNLRTKGKIYGPLSRLFSVKEKYVTAIETALGAALQNIVVDDEDTAKAAIAYLKQTKGGRATFYPISAMTSPSETEEGKKASSFRGFVDRADKLVETDALFRGIIESQLIRTVVFDTLDNAAEAAKTLRFRIRIVTLDGQVIHAGGSFTGGSSKRDSGILSRGSDIAALEKEAEKRDGEIAAVRQNLSDIEKEIEEAKNLAADAEQNKTLLSTLAGSQLSAADHAKANYEANENILSRLEEDLASLESTKTHAKDEVEALEKALERLNKQITSFRVQRNQQSESRDSLLRRKEELSEKINEINGQAIANQKDIESLQNEIDMHERNLTVLMGESRERRREVEAEEKKILALKEEHEENRRAFATCETAYKEAATRRTELLSMNEEFTARESELNLAIREKNDQNAATVTKFNRVESRLQNLQEESDRIGSRLYDDYELTSEDALQMDVPVITAENRAEYAQIQASCRAKLRAYGEFRPGAIEEYREVKERYDGLSTQVKDLDHASDELRSVIAKIEEEMRRDFITAFDAINRNFGLVFAELFGGGQAELSLTDTEDVLTSGIEIKAAPPGKIIKSLALLSGGEQTFVAIALLFAIIKVNPTPFCIFDEIEAALDEVNVYRFADYIKKLSKDSQFILITHRRGTMEVGNRLYGITMPERGISRAVLLDVAEIENKKKEAETWDSSKN